MSVRARAAAPARRRSAPARTRPVERTRPSRRPTTRTHARARPRARVLLRWVWVPGLAVLLGGIVFINAATLRLSTRSSITLQRTSEAQSEIVNLNQVLQQTDAQVRNAATRRLAMRQEVASQLTFLSAPNPAP